jgi:hypothetical protein
MVVVGHENIGVDLDGKPFGHLSGLLKKMAVVFIVIEYGPFFVAPGKDMVEGVGGVKPQGSCHAENVAGAVEAVKNKLKNEDVTPETLCRMCLENQP